MEQLLIANGYSYVGGCRCGGLRRSSYYNKNYRDFKVVVYPTRKTFTILRNNMKITDGNEDNLIEKLEQYEIIEATKAAV